MSKNECRNYWADPDTFSVVAYEMHAFTSPVRPVTSPSIDTLMTSSSPPFTLPKSKDFWEKDDEHLCADGGHLDKGSLDLNRMDDFICVVENSVM